MGGRPVGTGSEGKGKGKEGAKGGVGRRRQPRCKPLPLLLPAAPHLGLADRGRRCLLRRLRRTAVTTLLRTGGAGAASGVAGSGALAVVRGCQPGRQQLRLQQLRLRRGKGGLRHALRGVVKLVLCRRRRRGWRCSRRRCRRGRCRWGCCRRCTRRRRRGGQVGTQLRAGCGSSRRHATASAWRGSGQDSSASAGHAAPNRAEGLTRAALGGGADASLDVVRVVRALLLLRRARRRRAQYSRAG